MVLFLYRDEYYNEQSEDKGIAEIICGKNRHGATGTVKLAFVGERVMFADLAYDMSDKAVSVAEREVSAQSKGRNHD
jgi:hypothetical protein